MTDQECINTLEFMMQAAEARLKLIRREEHNSRGLTLGLIDERMLARRNYVIAKAALIVIRQSQEEQES